MQPNYPQQQYQQQAMQAPSPPPGADPFSDPSGGAAGPNMRNLDGRVVIMQPINIDENNTYQGQPRPNATYNLTVVDGGPLMYGDSEDRANPRPYTSRIETPCHFRGIQTGSSEIVKALRTELAKGPSPSTGQMGLIVGRIFRGTKGNKPWLIERLDPADPRRQAAVQIYVAMQGGTFVNPEPVDLMPGTGVPQNGAAVQQHYGQAQQYGQPQYVPQNPAAGQFAQTAAQGQPWQQSYAPAQTGNPAAVHGPANVFAGAPQQGPGPQVGQLPQQQYAPQPAAGGSEIPPPPPNFDPNMWASLSADARNAILAQQNAAQAGQQQNMQAPPY